jgi:hypothetical protein
VSTPSLLSLVPPTNVESVVAAISAANPEDALAAPDSPTPDQAADRPSSNRPEARSSSSSDEVSPASDEDTHRQSARRRRKRLLRAMLRLTQAATHNVVYKPAAATGSAYDHPAAAHAAVLCDVAELGLTFFPPGHVHAFLGLAIHLVMDLLLASPY